MKSIQKPVNQMNKKELAEHYKRERIEKERKKADMERSVANQIYFRNNVY
jgi:hypothetical protein